MRTLYAIICLMMAYTHNVYADKEKCYMDCMVEPPPSDARDITDYHFCAIKCKVWWVGVDGKLDFNYKGGLYQCVYQDSKGLQLSWVMATDKKECLKYPFVNYWTIFENE